MSEASLHILETFHGILRAAVESGASDVHLKSGEAVKFRINGEIARRWRIRRTRRRYG